MSEVDDIVMMTGNFTCRFLRLVSSLHVSFYRAVLRISRYCYGKLSVRLSVTLRYRDHIG